MKKFENKKLFTEYHHGGLLHSISLMFEKRLGIKVYTPTGKEWYENGYWRYSDNKEVIEQYLGDKELYKKDDEYLYWLDKAENHEHRRITLDQFKKEKFDYLLCTLEQDEEAYIQLKNKYQPQATLLRLVGNGNEYVYHYEYRKIIDTSGHLPYLVGRNKIVIHQEFDLNIFKYQPIKNYNVIGSFQNLPHRSPYYHIWQNLKALLPEYKFIEHGIESDDGNITGIKELAQKMSECSIIYHLKHEGEGFGHIIHNALAIGRPVIVISNLYRNKIAAPLILDGSTSIWADRYTLMDLAERIKQFTEVGLLERISILIRDRFKKIVNFDENQKKLEDLLFLP